MIDKLLGGSNADLFIPQRPLTAIELRLVQKIIDLGMQAMEEAWAVVTPSKFAMEDTESNPQLVQIVPPNEVVVVVKFELKMGNCAGTIGLCIPYKVIEPVIEKLSNKSWASHKLNQRDEELRRHVAMRLNTAKLTVTTVLTDTSIKLSELINLCEGDAILTEKHAASPLTLTIEGKRKYIGHLGQFKGNLAFKVQRAYQQKDRV